MKNQSHKIVVVGTCGAPHGIKGAVKVFSDTDPIDNILLYKPWLIERKGEWQPITIKSAEAHTQHIAVQFEGIHDRDQAQRLTHCKIGIYRHQLPALPDGQYYWTDLEGLEVSNLEGFVFGKITRLLNTGANDVMFIQGEKEHCLPYLLNRVVKKVDLNARKMLVDWPEEI